MSASLENEASQKSAVHRIVLTGGPCGGKSTAMSSLSQRLQSLGYQVFLVPEVATLLITGGLQLSGRTRSQWVEIEAQVMQVQRQLEDSFDSIARLSDKPAVILCDRGLCDNRAYMEAEDFDSILARQNETLGDVRDVRYDAVIHLVTAAIGAEAHYTTANNTARTEGIEEARKLDKKTLECWLGHRQLWVVDNSTSFQEKITRVVNRICMVIGAVPKAPERKFLLLDGSPTLPASLATENFEVDIMIFQGKDGAQMRAIRRRQGPHSSYAVTESKTKGDGGAPVVQSKTISRREFDIIQARGNQHVRKRMHYFLWEGRYYAVNEYLLDDDVLATVEVEDQASLPVEDLVPSFLGAVREVTNDSAFTSEGIASQTSQKE